MLKRILGQAPFNVSFEEDVLVVPGKSTEISLLFENESEYDLPLSCLFRIESSLKIDCLEFDIVLPAEGKTKKTLVFSLGDDEKIIGGENVCELEIIDRILDTKTVYELEIKGEMAYKCSELISEAFLPSDEAVFTRNGRFFANKDEIIAIEIPTSEETETQLSVISGKVRNFHDGQTIKLDAGLNRIIFDMEQDGCFEFVNSVSGDRMFCRTLNPKYYI